MGSLAWAGDSDYQSEIREHQQAAGYESPPRFAARRLLKERGEASGHENEMADSADGYHHRFKVLDLTRM